MVPRVKRPATLRAGVKALHGAPGGVCRHALQLRLFPRALYGARQHVHVTLICVTCQSQRTHYHSCPCQTAGNMIKCSTVAAHRLTALFVHLHPCFDRFTPPHQTTCVGETRSRRRTVRGQHIASVSCQRCVWSDSLLCAFAALQSQCAEANAATSVTPADRGLGQPRGGHPGWHLRQAPSLSLSLSS